MPRTGNNWSSQTGPILVITWTALCDRKTRKVCGYARHPHFTRLHCRRAGSNDQWRRLAAQWQKCALTVIPVEGWKHGQPYSLPVKPSPNLPNDQAIALYPSLCPFEGTAISVGRGTLYPFQVIGSPDIRISSFSFRPEALEGFDKNPMYKNQYCYGNNLRHITAPKGFSLKYIITYYQAYQDLGKADKFFTRPQWFDLLIGNRTVREQIMKGASEEEIRAGWQNELEAYKKMREKYLLYE